MWCGILRGVTLCGVVAVCVVWKGWCGGVCYGVVVVVCAVRVTETERKHEENTYKCVMLFKVEVNVPSQALQGHRSIQQQVPK